MFSNKFLIFIIDSDCYGRSNSGKIARERKKSCKKSIGFKFYKYLVTDVELPSWKT